MQKQPTHACLVCGEDKAERFSIYFDGFIKLFRCHTCSFVAQYPGPGKDARVDSYREYYDLAFLDQGKEWMYPEREQVLHDIARRIHDVHPSGKLLDVGCGDGLFLAQAKKFGYTCFGIEDSADLSGYAKKKTGATVLTGQYNADSFPPHSFDVISFIQVVEHLPDPISVLGIVRQHLAPNGLLVIEVPSIHAPHFLAYSLTGMKKFVDNPHGIIDCHIGYYTPRTMRQLTDTAGFTEQQLVTGRWKYKYHGALKAMAHVLDPLFQVSGIGGILYIGKPSQIDKTASKR